jgi:hypothetical protein
VPGATLTQGARVPGTSLELEPARAAFNLGAMMDGAALAAILPVADYLARKAHNEATAPPLLRDVLAAICEARHLPPADGAIAGVMHLLGASRSQLAAALQLDRHPIAAAPASRRSCGEAAAQAVRISFRVMAGAAESPAIQPGRSPAGPIAARAPGDDFAASVEALFPVPQAALIRERIANRISIDATPVHEFVALLVRNG